MANTYTTTINSLYTIPNPAGYVVNVLFTVSGTDGTHTDSIDGNIQFEAKQEANVAKTIASNLGQTALEQAYQTNETVWSIWPESCDSRNIRI